MKKSVRLSCLAARSAPIASWSLIVNTASILSKAVNRPTMTSKPPSRVTLPFWLSDRILMLGLLASDSLQPLTRSSTDAAEHRRGRRAGDDDDVAGAAE